MVLTYGIAQLLRLLDLLAELSAATTHWGEIVEQKTHGAGKDTLNLPNFIPCLDQLLQCRDDGQPGTDGALVIDHASGDVIRRCEDVFPESITPRESLLVGRHHVYPLLEDSWIGLGNILTAGVVDKDHRPRSIGKMLNNLIQR